MITQWIQACEVQRVSLVGGLVLNLEDYNELVITRPLRLSLPPVGAHPAEDVLVDPNDVPNFQRPLLNFAGSVCTRANCDDDGTLRVEFSNGYGFTVAADESFTAWELYGKRHGYMACLPGGRVRVVRHDLPEDDLVSERPAVRP
ncbi:hypothetical protein AWC18_00360 [Mycolicibacter nonchromogenicus]|uniref:Uncharacterized protein n=1 Tax=Mycolicibacter nonchromogenicus TaxID=1782 RepID=A0A1X1ZL88_MYCNO|nr:DUF6188 family protein [Mycolicibacter nonchromogenicus]ORW24117.1 hypothetical protein AWC18_00360 [Mycolicibacter nonchromogenicus]